MIKDINMFIGNKDVDLLILNKLDDKDIISMRLTCKYFNNLLNNEDLFWLNKSISKFKLPIDIMKRFKKNNS